MLTLFLDFCSHQKVIALVDGDRTIALKYVEDHTEESTIIPLIQDLLTEAETTRYPLPTIRSSVPIQPFEKLSRIAAVTGPGGFMSQRVGLAVANALSWSLNIPIAGMHLSDLWHARAHRSSLIAQDFIWLHSTKKQLLFIRGFGSFAKSWPEPVTITLDELKTVSEGQYVGEVLPEQAAVLRIKPLAALAPVSDVLPTITTTLSYTETPLTPWYGRGA